MPAAIHSPASAEFEALLADLRQLAPELEAEDVSPMRQLRSMSDYGVMQWGIPAEYGGVELEKRDETFGYLQLASACLTSTFVLSQRAAAITRLVSSENQQLREDLLPKFARHELFTTVGISHLTTSRRHLGKPAVHAEPTDNGFVLNGTIPWVTGASFADLILCGATLDDGREILIFIEQSQPGITIGEPPKLLALNASRTGEVQLENVEASSAYLVAGPVEKVMKGNVGGVTGSLTTSALATGAALGTLQLLKEETASREEIAEMASPLYAELDALQEDLSYMLTHVAEELPEHLTTETIRQRANSLALRSSQAYLVACKGAGFVAGHPAERLVREAMFFVVWSCPQPVMAAAMRECCTF
ncbi:acyl-CoA dehydrogenase family protein [Calycomorphotria hydatis]|uniref:Acryloyl-CoA reductase (NADH) n=1 Tax=Calycomorphotria hydatis TaxID=2528027 RepID=A0A517T478_9PLAN|nr:acyl-CoA dehydrogenase family protein [Calycomorphotria hydatis]QDT63184.1 Acryloyl-CoA reductase (NADH) [Calycomorphotria hydatis]